MPGLKKSPGMADIDVCYGAHKAGTQGVQTAIQKARLRFEQSRLQEVGALDQKRYSEVISSPEEERDASGLLDEEPPSPLSVHEALSNGATSPLQERETTEQQQVNGLASSPHPDDTTDIPSVDQKPTSQPVYEELANTGPSPQRSMPFESFGSDESRLPPTPPSMNNSNEAVTRQDETLNGAAQFENALASKQSGQTMTPVNQPASPPTPDPSPPRNQQSTPTPEMQTISKPQFLSPPLDPTVNERSPIDGASSRAESFRTAQEDYSLESNAKMSPVHLPENDRLPAHWLDTTRELQSASIGLANVNVQQTPKIEEVRDPRRSASEKYPAGHRSKGLGIVNDSETARSASQQTQDRNNAVYKRLREENVKRHSTVSAGSGAITVGISIPSPELTPRTLRRQNKRSSLRVSSTPGSERDGSIKAAEQTPTSGDTIRRTGLGIDGGRTLKVRKARELDKNSVLTDSPLFGKSTLEDSPVLESSIRQVSSPAKLGPDASDMTALTYASLQDSPSANKRLSKFQSDPPHKLRHLSYEDRLSRNMSVRRTSLEASPPMIDTSFQAKKVPQQKLRSPSPGGSRVQNNIAVKRTQPSEAKAAHTFVQASTSAPRVATPPQVPLLERSPGGTLRHFSREERLENSPSVRRASLEQPPPLSTVQAESAAPRGSFDKAIPSAFSPQSPRKSLDARYLHPTTTPMSISQFSDRTENIEIGEANGVQFYPHTNESLLVVQNLSRPGSNEKDASEAPNFFPLPPEGISYRAPPSSLARPVFSARIEPPTPTLSMSKPAHQVDSPLINPRTAPEPPIFKVIPPTPERELENHFDTRMPVQVSTANGANRRPRPRLSLVQRARRYSDIMFPNLGSLRISRDRRSPEERATHLSPTWRPQGFWDDFDSDGEDYYDDFEPAGTLPRGGDTSDTPEKESQQRQRSAFLPRAMSKRLPGFRGTGGFLQGNSLGIDRHGTNNRRHYVSTGTRTLSKQQSAEVIRNLSQTAGRMSPDQRLVKQRRRFVALPFTAKRLRARMTAIRLKKEEKEREARRERLRRSIGLRVYHDT